MEATLSNNSGKQKAKSGVVPPAAWHDYARVCSWIPGIPVEQVNKALGLSVCLQAASESSTKPLEQFKMEKDDSPLLAGLYRGLSPRRHLEFGTWRGWGAALVLENSPATVWTLNLPWGEIQNGKLSYSEPVRGIDQALEEALQKLVGGQGAGSWATRRTLEAIRPLLTRALRAACQSMGLQVRDLGSVQTDTLGEIGRVYLQKNLGHRVNQIYCDSKDWDTGRYPSDFFDSVLIDGGHDEDVVVNDTHKALQVVRGGGLFIWHDFCPWKEVEDCCSSVRGVHSAVDKMKPVLEREFDSLYWIEPSWLLVGRRKLSRS